MLASEHWAQFWMQDVQVTPFWKVFSGQTQAFPWKTRSPEQSEQVLASEHWEQFWMHDVHPPPLSKLPTGQAHVFVLSPTYPS